MADGFAQLDAMIRKVRAIPGLAVKAAPEVADQVRRDLEQSIAAGAAPDGTAWKPTKAGGRPLAHAAKALSVRAVGSVILVTLTGPEARHHRGTARGHVRRPIIPTRKLPAPMAKAIRTVFERRFAAMMRGRL